MKQQLPAKYSKMTVCTFWLLKQLKSMDVLSDDQMADMSQHFAIFKESEDQMLFFKDLVENFKEHENYLKMYVNARHLDESAKDEHQDKEEQIVSELPTVETKKNKNLSESELIKKMLLEDSDEDDDNDDNKDDDEATTFNEKKVEEEIVEKKQKIILKIKIKK